MAWSAPSSRSTGELITAAIWNQDVVANVTYLHDRAETIWLPYVKADAESSLGDWDPIGSVNNQTANSVFFRFHIPDDADSVTAIEMIYVASASGGFEYDIESDYGAEGEAYNANSESATNQSETVVANELAALDVSGVFSSIAAGDHCALEFLGSTGATAGFWYPIAIKVTYTRV